MTAERWFEVGIGFILPTVAILWGIWSEWRDVAGGPRRPPRSLDGVVRFLLTCVLVVVLVLSWEMVQVWRVRGSAALHSPATQYGAPASTGSEPKT